MQADQTYYNTTSAPGELPTGYDFALSSSDVDQLLQFANATGLSIVFGLNAGMGPRSGAMTNAWGDDNARALLTYIRCIIYSLVVLFQPNLTYAHIRILFVALWR